MVAANERNSLQCVRKRHVGFHSLRALAILVLFAIGAHQCEKAGAPVTPAEIIEHVEDAAK